VTQGLYVEARAPQRWLFDPSEELPHDSSFPISNLLYHIWRSRTDLQRAFDLNTFASRVRFCEWFVVHGSVEYGIHGWACPAGLLRTLSKSRGQVGQRARALLKDRLLSSDASEDVAAFRDGANLIGHARGEFGMGEHVRAVAEALQSVGSPFSMVSLSGAGIHGENEQLVGDWIGSRRDYATNIFHVNADVFPTLYGHFPPSFFNGRYNIGYWAWELARCPEEFVTAISMVDEVWAISDFVAQAFRSFTDIPVVNMPIAVELPPLPGKLPRQGLGIDEDEFVFLFTFDAASYLHRKNPLGLIQAFSAAFPRKDERVRLILKTMNVSAADPYWMMIAAEAAKDRRITVVDQRLTREEVLRMSLTCDAFVSLHRSEGFGRCLAEAMVLGKPVIATGYSGSNEFVTEATACVVDYELVPVPPGSYPYSENQVWAEPNIEQAANHMGRIAADQGFRERIAKAGQAFVRANFNSTVVGARYMDRLEKIRDRRAFPISASTASR